MSEWILRTVDSLCERIGSGGTPSRRRPDYFEPAEIPWVKSSDLRDATITETEECISELGLSQSAAKIWPAGTVLMAMYGLGTAGRLGILNAPAACNQAICAMVANQAVCDYRWLFYQLKADRARIEQSTNGAVQQNISASAIRRYEYLTPPLPEQQAIAEVLGALDDKIAANTALALSADQLASVEFSRVLKSHPYGDEAIGSIATVVLGGTPSRSKPEYWTGGTVAWLNSGAANSTRIISPTALITEEALARSAAKVMPVGTTLIAITGATLGQVARLEIQAAGNQSLVGVWSEVASTNVWLYHAIHSRLDDLLSRATGAAQQHVSKGDVVNLLVPLPHIAVQQRFADIALPLANASANAERESRTLSEIRDALLPQLMSGKLRVRDAERIASEAGA